ncbi:PspC domain-containing protein [Cryobacterium sandaracinum]|uniref:PspC domain-containing protein n=1 Tax=Cryobacterium sandaracinum TaxID=1259247 RepID=A0ABY2JKS0_9MICO|nr:PspC domain-containing protein [Cryobacterium sandaracinum]TFD06265.1 PspC domain-containing protein [Cryobacterium sandaracinum]
MTDAPESQTTPSAAGPGTPPTPSDESNDFFAAIRSTGIVRGSDRWLAGVCGGVALRAGLNPTLVRVVTIALGVLGGPVLFTYAVGWALLPGPTGRIHAEQAVRGVFPPVMIGIIALVGISFASYTRSLWWQSPAAVLPDWLATTLAVGWSVGVTIGLIWLVFFLARRTTAPAGGYPHSTAAEGIGAGVAFGAMQPAEAAGSSGTAGTAGGAVTVGGPAAPPPGRGSWRDLRPGAGFSAIVLGSALLCGAVAAGVWSGGNWSDAALVLGLAVTLGVLAVGIIVSGIRGKQSGALGGFAFLAAVALVLLGLFPSGTAFFLVGIPVWTVSADADAAPPGYAVLSGRATIDLTALNAASVEDRTIDIWMGVGVTELILPRGRAVLVETNALAGRIDYVGGSVAVQQGGAFYSDSRTFNDDGTGTVARVRVWTALGQVTVVGPSRLEP